MPTTPTIRNRRLQRPFTICWKIDSLQSLFISRVYIYLGGFCFPFFFYLLRRDLYTYILKCVVMETSLRYGGDTKALRIHAKEKFPIDLKTHLLVRFNPFCSFHVWFICFTLLFIRLWFYPSQSSIFMCRLLIFWEYRMVLNHGYGRNVQNAYKS